MSHDLGADLDQLFAQRGSPPIFGKIKDLEGRIIHDDRKPLNRWLASQARYMALETERLQKIDQQDLQLSDRLRRVPLIMPFLSFFYCLLAKGLILDGKAGLHYASQRLIAEAVLSLMLLDESCQGKQNRKQPV